MPKRSLNETIFSAERGYVNHVGTIRLSVPGEPGLVTYEQPHPDIGTEQQFADYERLLTTVESWHMNPESAHPDYGLCYEPPRPDMESLALTRLVLATTLKAKQEADAEYKNALLAFEQEHADLNQRRAQLAELAERYDLEMRRDAVAWWKTHEGARQVVPGVAIDRVTTPEYDEAELREWALAHAHFLLELDPKAIKALAIAIRDNKVLQGAFADMPLNVLEKPTAEISTALLVKWAQEQE